jgi:hypothetical protein
MRAKSKKELSEQSEKSYNSLINRIKDLPESEILKPRDKGKTFKDLLAHLHAWHLLMLEWYKVGMSGEKPEMPAPGYTWKDAVKLNYDLYLKYKDTPLNKVLKLLEKSHKEVTKLIQKHSDKELLTKKNYKWTGSTSLGQYLESSTSSHYEWAIALVKNPDKKNSSASYNK